MKDLIINALDDCFLYCCKNVSRITRRENLICIDEVKPKELPAFMRKNDIPDGADFYIRSDQYLYLVWYTIEEASEIEINQRIQVKFMNLASQLVYKALYNAGYKRVGVNSAKLKGWPTVWDMFSSGNWEGLVNYYSMFFKKENDL